MLLSYFFSLCVSFFNEFERFGTGILQFKFCMNVEICIKLPTFEDIQLFQKRLSFKSIKPKTLSAQGMMGNLLFRVSNEEYLPCYNTRQHNKHS